MKNVIKNVAILMAIISTSCTNSLKTNTIEGKLKRETVSLAPKVAGRIIEVRVEEAAFVKKGDTLAVIEIPEIEAKLEQAKGGVLSAKSQFVMAKNGATKEQIEQAEAMYKAANEQFEFARKTYERIKTMYADSLVSAQKYDEVIGKYMSAKAQLEAASAKRSEITLGVRHEQIEMAEGQYKLALGKLKEAEVAYSERYILAPKDMSIETISLQVGELALPGYNLFVGYDMQEIYFRFTVSESIVNQFFKGQEFNVDLPFDKISIETKLTAVKQLAAYADRTSSYPQYSLGESVYELKLTPKNINDVLKYYNNSIALLKL